MQELAAALSYYTLLSLTPLLSMAVAVAALVLERHAVEGRILAEMRALVGDEGAEVVRTVLGHPNDPAQSARSVLIGGGLPVTARVNGRPFRARSTRARSGSP